MSEKSLYLKYRPRNLDDLVGQENFVRTIKQASKYNKYVHSYLLCGVKGCGKTTSARIISNLLNCEDVQEGKVCGKCLSCQTIPSGTATDVVELDGAKQRKVEDINNLIESASWSPVNLKKKVFVIDECLGKNSRIETDQGLIPVSRIVSQKMEVNAKSYNHETGEIEYKPITGWFKNSGKDVFKINFESKGVLYASANHLISTPDGYKKVCELNVGDLVERTEDFDQVILHTEEVVYEKVTRKKLSGYENVTYDIEVADNHNYFVSGTLVHNCHQLSSTAISSLLKIVEEPPEYLVFIFCTTEPDKIPDTILSRSQRHIFSKIPSKKIASRLRYICEQEGIKSDEGSLFSIAQIGRGSMRDAIGYLEQMSTVIGEGTITEKLVNEYFCMADRKGVYDIIGSMAKGDYSMVMERCNDMIIGAVDIRSLLFEISEVFRNILMIKLQGENTKLVDLPDHEIQRIIKLSGGIGLSQLNTLSKEFSTIEKELKYSINKRLVLESTLVRCTARLQQKK